MCVCVCVCICVCVCEVYVCVCMCACMCMCEVYVGTFVFVLVCMSGWGDYMLQSINRGSLRYSGLLLRSIRNATYKYGVICYTNFIHQLPPKLIVTCKHSRKQTFNCGPPPSTFHLPSPSTPHPINHRRSPRWQNPLMDKEKKVARRNVLSCLSELKPNNCPQLTTNYM